MAITLNALTPAKFGFSANGYSANMSGCEEFVAAPGAGKYLCVTHLTVNVGANLTVTIGSGESGPGSVEAVLIGPIVMLAGATLQWNFRNGGVVLPENKSLTCDSSGAGDMTVFAEGHTI